MIWSFLKIALFLVMVAALTLGASLPGRKRRGYSRCGGGHRIHARPVAGCIGCAGAVRAGLAGAARARACSARCCVSSTATKPRISRYFDRNRERKGYEALAEGMMAVASGEGRVALAKAAKAEKYLRSARTDQSAFGAGSRSGGRHRARRPRFTSALLGDQRTRFVGRAGPDEAKACRGRYRQPR